MCQAWDTKKGKTVLREEVICPRSEPGLEARSANSQSNTSLLTLYKYIYATGTHMISMLGLGMSLDSLQVGSIVIY